MPIRFADDDPPETWQTAKRLLALGLGREKVMRQIAICMPAQLAAAAGPEKRPYDAESIWGLSPSCPLPQAEDIRNTFVALARAHQPVDSEGPTPPGMITFRVDRLRRQLDM